MGGAVFFLGIRAPSEGEVCSSEREREGGRGENGGEGGMCGERGGEGRGSLASILCSSLNNGVLRLGRYCRLHGDQQPMPSEQSLRS